MQNQHILIVTIGSQGQLNPARRLAVRLAGLSSSVRITLAIPLHYFLRLFPSSPPNHPQPLPRRTPHQIFFSSFSDGSDDGFDPNTDDGYLFMRKFKQVGSQTLSNLIHDLSSQGHPITRIIYTILLSWVADIAGDLNIPSFFYWIQPASVFTIYYHYFNSTTFKDDLITKPLIPGLPPLSSKDLPSLLCNSTSDPYLPDFELIFKNLTKTKPKVLVNSFTALESGVISSFADKLELLAIGPLVDVDVDDDVSVHEHDSSQDYMEWLDSKDERSVVYISFGSLSAFSERQVEEILKGLEESGRPYLWVLRRNNRGQGIEDKFINKINNSKAKLGKVVGWCSQVRVLRHSAVGCFVTHCGWNSMSESLVTGVPMVMVPQWVDQMTNAKMAEVEWRVGVRVEVEDDGVVVGEELRRCLEVVMGEGSEGVEISRRASFWKDKAAEALGPDGSAAVNLNTFIKGAF